MKIFDITHPDSVVREYEGKCLTLSARMGTGGNQVPSVLGAPQRIYNSHLSYGVVKEETLCKTLTSQIENQTDSPLVLSENGNDRTVDVDISPPLKTASVASVSFGSRVRRLTPLECERLQGFPDNWTQIPYRKKSAEQCPDAPRYKAIGNSWAVPVVRWIGQRIQNEIDKPSE